MRMPDSRSPAGGALPAQREADPRYWQDVVRFRWLITFAYVALTAGGILPYNPPWFWIAAVVLTSCTVAYTIYRQRTNEYTLYEDVASCLDVVCVALVLIGIGTIDSPIWVAYAFVIPTIANFKSHRFNIAFAGFVLLTYGAAYAVTQALGDDGDLARTAVVTAILLLLLTIDASIGSANNRRLRDVVRAQAVTDPLTGLANRRLLFDRLEHWPPSSRALAVMMIDLDDFKVLNESLGHITADRILASAGELLLKHGGEGSLAARFGGDEFALLVEVDDREDAQRLADQLITEARERIGIGMTAGIALCPDDAATPERALHLADAHLRRAKTAGKERAVVRQAA